MTQEIALLIACAVFAAPGARAQAATARAGEPSTPTAASSTPFAALSPPPETSARLAAPLGLRQAIDFGIAHSPTLEAARKTLEVRELELKSAVSRLFPSIDLSATHGLQSDIPLSTGNLSTPVFTTNPTAPWYSALSLSLAETIYDNGASLTGVHTARLNRDYAELNFTKIHDSLILDISSEFYRFSLASILLDVRKRQREVLDRQLRALSAQYHQGLRTESDFLRIQSQAQQSEIDQISAENALRQNTLELRKLLGDGRLTRGGGAGSLEFTPLVARPDAIETAFPDRAPPAEGGYEARLARLQDEINSDAVTLARRSYWPQLTATAGVTYANQNYLHNTTPGASFTDNQQVSWNALLVVKYNLWDWGIGRRSVQIAEFNQDVQRATLDTGLLETAKQIETAMLDIGRLRRSFGLSRAVLRMEETSNRNLEVQYREGKVNYLDLVTGLNGLLNARVQFYTTYFDVLQALVKIDFYGGKISEADLERR